MLELSKARAWWRKGASVARGGVEDDVSGRGAVVAVVVQLAGRVGWMSTWVRGVETRGGVAWRRRGVSRRNETRRVVVAGKDNGG